MFYRGKKCLFYHFFMENHSIQFTTISINVERGIDKILFKYRYFQDLLIDIDISLILLIDIDIDIFQNRHIDIDIDIFWIALSISISIFSNMTISILISISIFFKSVDISTIDMSYRYIEQGYQGTKDSVGGQRAGGLINGERTDVHIWTYTSIWQMFIGTLIL